VSLAVYESLSVTLYQQSIHRILSKFHSHGSDSLRSRTKAQESVDHFLRSLFMECHARFIRSIEYCHDNGVHMIIPGLGVRVVRTYVAALCGDKPALHAMIGLKVGTCLRGCHICCYDMKNNKDPYDPNVHKERDFGLLLRAQNFCREYTIRIEAGEDVSVHAERFAACTKFCTFYGAHPMVTTLTTKAHGYDCRSAVFKTAVRDIFHDLEAGVFPSIIMMVLRIIQAISKNDDRYHDVIGELDQYTSTRRMMRHPPRYKKMDHTNFHEGCASLLLNTATGQANAGVTGTTAGMRSSWSKVMMAALLVAIGTSNGAILPKDNLYFLKRTVRVTTTKKEDIPVEGQSSSKSKKRKRTITETQTRNDTVCIGHPTRLCCQALAIALDVFAEFHRDVWTPGVVVQVEQKVRELQAVVTVLHQVMVAACRVSSKEEDYQVWLLSIFYIHNLKQYSVYP
jgi:hypothetical protein